MIGPDRGQDSAATVDRKGCRRSIELTQDRICRGSLQNKPAANGSCGGPAVGTGKQRKQQEAFQAQHTAEDHFAARWTGLVQVLVGGNYTFYTRSDDGTKVIVANELVVENDGLHGAEEWKGGTIELQVGWHPVTVIGLIPGP